MNRGALISIGNLKIIERAILIVGSIALIVSTLLLLSTGLNHFKIVESDAKLALAKKEIVGLTDTIEKAKRVTFQPESKRELSVVQVTMDRLANEQNCQLQEVTSTNDTVSFSTHYKKGLDEKGWKQLAMSGQIVGSLTNVMAFTRKLANISIPIELLAIDILPISTKPGDRSKVSAKFSFQILKQETSQ